MSAAARPLFRDLEGLRVLVVDDDADARELLEAILSDCGALVSVASSAAAAFALAIDTTFDLIVSDVGMPEEDGYALIRRIRRLPGPVSKARAVAVTAYATREDRADALAAGFDEHLPKPLDLAALARFVAKR